MHHYADTRRRDYHDAILAAALQGDLGDQGVFHDWLLDSGHDWPQEAYLCRPMTYWDIWSFCSGIGRGSGSGSGIGSGRGRGSGIGSGRGIGSGIGIGIGIGSGIGIGRGRGSGRGSGSSGPFRSKPMRIGQAYLVHCGDWHTFVGRVVEQIGPGTYEMECVSKVAETNNGDCWFQLAAGNDGLRSACSYKHLGKHPDTGEWLRMALPLVIAAFEWAGQLPQEAGLPDS